MARADYLELGFGASRWMEYAQGLLSLLGLLAILISPASWGLKLTASLLLATASVCMRRVSGSNTNTGTIRVFMDGTAMLSTETEKRVFATLSSHHWISPWFCSVAMYLAKGGKKKHVVICADANDSNEYRRLLKYLRMKPKTDKADRMIW